METFKAYGFIGRMSTVSCMMWKYIIMTKYACIFYLILNLVDSVFLYNT